MNIVKDIDKKAIDTSKNSNNKDFNGVMLSEFESVAQQYNFEIENLDNYIYQTLQVCESLSNELDDILQRSPFTISSTILNYQAHFYNKQVQFMINELKKKLEK